MRHCLAVLSMLFIWCVGDGEAAPAAKIDYKDALKKSLLFYEAQRSGILPDDNMISWRNDSHVDDGDEINIDLSGGWYNSEGSMKYTNTISYASTVIITAMEFFDEGFGNLRKLAMREVKWGLDYLMKCLIKDEKLVIQVGNQKMQWSTWERPEDENTSRPVLWLGHGRPKGGAFIFGDYAAAMAAGSVLLMKDDPEQSDEMMAKAEAAYKLGLRNKVNIKKVYPKFVYQSSGFYDELALAASWLGYAKSKRKDMEAMKKYVKEAESHLVKAGMHIEINGLSIREKSPLANIMLYKLTGNSLFKEATQLFLDQYTEEIFPRTPEGLVFVSKWRNNRYVASSAFVALLAAKEGINATGYENYAKTQIDVLLGAKGMSYVVGVGKHYPKRLFHKAASCPLLPSPCGWLFESSPNPDKHTLYGALVAGPRNAMGDYVDRRSTYNDVSLNMNSGLVAALAGLMDLTKQSSSV